MRHSVLLREEAEQDLFDTSLWYEQQRPRLGHEFLDDVQSVIDRISEQPLSFPLVHRSARRAVLNRFPFCVYFLVEDAAIVVFAIIHGSRHPRRWMSRR
jgi:plasmid stabilization system protein ParE